MARRRPEDLRSYRWYGVSDLRPFGHRSRTAQMGYYGNDYIGKPVIAIINTWSDINPCHVHFRQRVEEVKRGVWEAGGFPLEIPAMSLSENFQKPTTMLYRNLLAMRSRGDAARPIPSTAPVLMGGCDKTTPALLMGATSMNIARPLHAGRTHAARQLARIVLGSGVGRLEVLGRPARGPDLQADWKEIEDGIARSPGHCMTMGTASTMTSAVEALGVTLPGAVSIPAADSRHGAMATETGRRDRRDGLGGPEASTSSHPRPSATPSPPSSRSAARPTPLCTWSRWHGAPVSRCRLTASTNSHRTPLVANIRPPAST